MSKIILLFIICTLFQDRYMETITSKGPRYNVLTPDGTTFCFQRVGRKEAEEILKRFPAADTIMHKVLFAELPAYVYQDGKVLYEKTLDSYFFLFSAKEDFDKFLRGRTYFDASISFDKDNNIHSCFHLQPSITQEFLDKPHLEDNSYPGDLVNLEPKLYLYNDGSVCYFTNRGANLKDADWFATKDDFEFFYFNIFN